MARLLLCFDRKYVPSLLMVKGTSSKVNLDFTFSRSWDLELFSISNIDSASQSVVGIFQG